MDVMAREIKLSHLDSVLEGIEYPCSKADAVDFGGDVTLLLADGTENLGDLLETSNDAVFESMDELSNEVMNLLPQHAVGEPYQSEGEG